MNLSAFETFFDEKRPFFIEGSRLLNSGYEGYFYSRRIGGAPIGPAPGDFVDYPRTSTILGAGKLTGRLPSKTSIGILGAVTDAVDLERLRVAVGHALDHVGHERAREAVQGAVLATVAGALDENEYRTKLKAAGFEQIEIEPTRIYRAEDAREFLSGHSIDVDSLAAQVDGKFMSAFVRAVKPAAKRACCAPSCCN